MIDYREEMDFKLALVLFLVVNFAENKNGKKLLTIEKLKLLILTCLSPKKLDIVSRKLNDKKINYLKNVFYDDSSEIFDADGLREAALLVAYMCNRNYLKIEKQESKYIVLGNMASDLSKVINESVPQYLSKNIKVIKSISGKSESLITKALLEA
ncbi:hypothetical protein J1N51_04630 [Psychrosphaera ytuae]|uniref:Uncharacterized protein n=1 Tax=Psychrosphaera ytuae TaxID=2820710 RepID=A0A975HJ17_9GAMM|nr:hypothetical protein [Psychrosphaera ytuae]QTH64753.1 hypothetical protein J1N51_04630 [Psychrosphaera ytuae]